MPGRRVLAAVVVLLLLASPALAGNGDDGLEIAEDRKAELLLQAAALTEERNLQEILDGLAGGRGIDKGKLSRVGDQVRLLLKLVPKLSAGGDGDIAARIADEVRHLEAVVSAGEMLDKAVERGNLVSRTRGTLSAQFKGRQVAYDESFRELERRGAIDEEEFEALHGAFAGARAASRKSLDSFHAVEIAGFRKLADEARSTVKHDRVRARLASAIRAADGKNVERAEQLVGLYSHLRYGDAGDPVFAALMKKVKSSEARLGKLLQALEGYESGFSRRIEEELREVGLEVVAVREETSLRVAEKVVEDQPRDFEETAIEYREWLDEVVRRRRRSEQDSKALLEEIESDLSGALKGYIENCMTDEERRIFGQGFDRIAESLEGRLETPLEALLAGWEDGARLQKKIGLLYEMAGIAREIEEWNTSLTKFFATVGTGTADLAALNGVGFEPVGLAANLLLKLPNTLKDRSYYARYEHIRSRARSAGVAEITFVNAPTYRQHIDNCLDLFPLFNSYAGATKTAAGWIRSMLDYWKDHRRLQQALEDPDKAFDDSTPAGSCFEREMDHLLLDDMTKLRAATEKDDFVKVLLSYLAEERGKLEREAGECPSEVASAVDGMLEKMTRALTDGLGELSREIRELKED